MERSHDDFNLECLDHKEFHQNKKLQKYQSVYIFRKYMLQAFYPNLIWTKQSSKRPKSKVSKMWKIMQNPSKSRFKNPLWAWISYCSHKIGPEKAIDTGTLGKSNFPFLATSYIVFLMSLTIWIHIYDRLVVPFLRRITGKDDGITILRRMGIGIFDISLRNHHDSICLGGWAFKNRWTIALIKPTLGILSVLVLIWFFI